VNHAKDCDQMEALLHTLDGDCSLFTKLSAVVFVY